MRLHVIRNSLRADLDTKTERGRLIRSAGATAALKIGGTLLAFGASLLYARALGPHGYGLYAYVLAWVAVLTIPAGLGLPQYLVREGAKYAGSVRWLCRWADRRVLISSVAAAILMACAVFLPQAAGARWLFVVAAPLPLLNSLTSIRGALLRARGWVARSQWPVLILGPITMLAALAVLWAWQGTLYPIELIAGMTGAALLPLLVSGSQLRTAASDSSQQPAPVSIGAALPFMWLGGLYLVNNRADIIMLGVLNGAHDAGVYAIASRAAQLVTFFMMAANMTIAPRIARLYADGDHALLQRLLSGAARRIFVFSAPVALLLTIFATPLIEHLYGQAFAGGAIALQILASARLINAFMGLNDPILNMTGHERLSAFSVALSALVNVALNAALIPSYGIEGAAFATGASLVVWNALLWFWIRRYLDLRPTAL